MTFTRINLINVVSASLVLSFVCMAPALANVKVKKSITVNADLKQAWDAVMSHQHAEKEFNKTVQAGNNPHVVMINEQFMRLPIVGSTSLKYTEENTPMQRVDYKLQQSKVLNQFEGTWNLEKSKNGNGTVITLDTTVDSWMVVPFKGKILKSLVSKSMDERLAYVKKRAEKQTSSN
ncbi:MAG: SRPBCC family protein [Cyanobacteria bacterium]|nr:SRPBCC family protein [Cyanobacteriota bacterium]